jgi:hypothetical protein
VYMLLTIIYVAAAVEHHDEESPAEAH